MKATTRSTAAAGTICMTGGVGNDRYYVDTTDDTVTRRRGRNRPGLRQRQLHADRGQPGRELSTNALGATAAINLTGNEIGQADHGNAGANVLNGGGGNDTLIGLGGNDTLVGGTGNDAMTGGIGQRHCIMSIPRATSSPRPPAGGTDRGLASVSYTLTAASEVETLSTNDARRDRRDQPHRQRARPASSTAMPAPTCSTAAAATTR